MKVQLLLCASALTGATMIASPVLSQDTPRTPTTPPDSGRQPTTPPSTPSTPTTPPGTPTTPPSGSGGSGGMSGQQSNAQMQALNNLVGTWEVTVKTFSPEGGSSAQASPTSQAQGTSTRSWILNNKILQEEVRCGEMRTLSKADSDLELVDAFVAQTTPPERPGATPTPPRPTTPPAPPPSTTPPTRTPPSTTPPTSTPPQPSPRGGDSSSSMMKSMQGHGLFGFDAQSKQFEHVWCDSTDSQLTLSTGTFNESDKTFTFNVERNPMAGRTPGANDFEQATPSGQQPPRPSQTPPPSGTTPPRSTPGAGAGSGSGSCANASMMGLDKVIIRVTGPDRHVVEYYKSSAGGQSAKFMEVAYTKAQ